MVINSVSNSFQISSSVSSNLLATRFLLYCTFGCFGFVLMSSLLNRILQNAVDNIKNEFMKINNGNFTSIVYHSNCTWISFFCQFIKIFF